MLGKVTAGTPVADDQRCLAIEGVEVKVRVVGGAHLIRRQLIHHRIARSGEVGKESVDACLNKLLKLLLRGLDGAVFVKR